MPIFHCKTCGQTHDGFPSFCHDRPTAYWDVPDDKRESDVFLTSDSCVIADRLFFVRGVLEIPIKGIEEAFTYGVWVSLSEENFIIWEDNYEVEKRSHIGPFFGWFCSLLPIYPDTLHLKSMVYLRDDEIRPRIVLEQTEHPLSIEQHEGISVERALEIVHILQMPPNDS